MRKKIAQFFCFAFWAFGILAVYVLARHFFFPPAPPYFLWLLPLFSAVAVMTVKEVWSTVNIWGENAGGISAIVIALFCFYGPPPIRDSSFAIPPRMLSLFVGFGTAVIVTVMVLFFLRRKDTRSRLISLTFNWIILMVWSVWLGFSIRHIATGNGWIFFTEALSAGFLCALGGMILTVFLLILREIVKLMLRLHRYAFSRPVKVQSVN